MIRQILYGPPRWLVCRLSADARMAINFWLLVLWLVPGLVLWFVLRDALWFIGFMSIYAIWTGHLGAFAAETPVKDEGK